MKNIFLILSFSVTAALGSKVNAQVTMVPAAFTAEDSVTITVDVTGTPMAGQTEAYIWAFCNLSGGGNDAVINGTWTNSSLAAKMTSVGTDKWRFGFIGTALFGRSPGELKDFGFLIKAKDGSKQSPDYKPYKFDPLTFTPTPLRIFPLKVGVDDVVTFNFDPSLSSDLTEQRMTPNTVSIGIYTEGGVLIGSKVSIPVKRTDNNKWSAAVIPSAVIVIPTGVKAAKLKYVFNGTMLDVSGIPTNVNSSEIEIVFTAMK